MTTPCWGPDFDALAAGVLALRGPVATPIRTA